MRSTTSWGWGLASGVALAALASSCRSADESPLSPLATVLAATAAAGDVPADSVKEERSGFLFPKTLRLDDSTEGAFFPWHGCDELPPGLTLHSPPPRGVSGQVLAVGIRTMYVFFTTYAIALYADPKDVRSALSSFKVGHATPHPSLAPSLVRWLIIEWRVRACMVGQEHSAEDLKKNQAVYDALRDGPFTKTIRLIPTGDTSGSHLRNGLVSAVAARMQDNKEEALKEFGNFFPAQLKKGMLIDFTWKKGGSLSGTHTTSQPLLLLLLLLLIFSCE